MWTSSEPATGAPFPARSGLGACRLGRPDRRFRATRPGGWPPPPARRPCSPSRPRACRPRGPPRPPPSAARAPLGACRDGPPWPRGPQPGGVPAKGGPLLACTARGEVGSALPADRPCGRAATAALPCDRDRAGGSVARTRTAASRLPHDPRIPDAGCRRRAHGRSLRRRLPAVRRVLATRPAEDRSQVNRALQGKHVRVRGAGQPRRRRVPAIPERSILVRSSSVTRKIRGGS